ncbi:MAG: hypothetical protein CVV64_14045 [Candidatus Wallbacteria bacterium HGW-Wallbacteria-1]|jgi:hypothetical protein|uniref:PEGA domain-containing protein n=1 Tax=Candidatus Wallbacteria bacterium HGW-Wallbacteria-1 TaxID=2013854 RepID=A0A2N1PMF8_9BACT|nr:MAG: hypothetical protein CVV64_14045 [Candidatus Wallbacteria bacterium HGW-Wallbacteria-1]
MFKMSGEFSVVRIDAWILILLSVITISAILNSVFITSALAQEEIGQLMIATVPPGATLYRDDGIIEGLTPQEMILIESGDHDIELVLEGYMPMRRTVKVWPNVVTEYRFELESLSGQIQCPHCGKHFADPTPAPNRNRRGKNFFQELNYLVYRAMDELMPGRTGMLGFAAVLNNPGAIGFGKDTTGPAGVRGLTAGTLGETNLIGKALPNSMDIIDRPSDMTEAQKQENRDHHRILP